MISVAVSFLAMAAHPRPGLTEDSSPVLVSHTLRPEGAGGRSLSVVLKSETPRFRDGDLLHVLVDGMPIESISPDKEREFHVVIGHLPSGRHRIAFRFARKDQTEWGEETVLTIRQNLPVLTEGGF